MAPAGSLVFLLGPAEALSSECLQSTELEAIQALGVRNAFALRIVVTTDLDGQFTRVCDAITPCFEPSRLWLGVYQQSGHHWHQRDCFALSEARNESCWFYPTDDGRYLSWQRHLQVTIGAGSVADPPPDLPADYNREAIALLWSLLADDSDFTCVGLTYAGRRIEWPLLQQRWADTALWCDFSVDSSQPTPLTMHARREVAKTGSEPAAGWDGRRDQA